MPNVPKWVADQVENLLPSKYLTIKVVDTIDYKAELRKVIFSADLRNIECYPGSCFLFRVGEKELRHYTPSAYDAEKGLFEVIFHLHGAGPGSALGGRLTVGDHLKVGIPGGRKMYDREKMVHFFFGDETSLGFYYALLNEIRINGQRAEGIFELDACNMGFAFDLMKVLKTPARPASAAIEYLQEYLLREPQLFTDTVFYLTGNVASVQQMRSVLKQHGISSKHIKVQGYWAEGRVGL